MTKSIVRIALAGALGASLMAGAAFAEPVKKPKFGTDPDKDQRYTHEQVRRQQVRQVNNPFTAIFHPLTSAWNQYTR